MKVSELALAGGVTAETVRHYTRKGLLHSRRNPKNGYQLYDDEALSYLRFIQCLRTLGFSLQEISDVLSQATQNTAPCPRARDVLSQRLSLIRSRIQELQTLSQRLNQTLVSWRDMPDATPTGDDINWLIEDLSRVDPQ